MPKERAKKKVTELRFKSGADNSVRKSTRRPSVRSLANFEIVREQFENLEMSNSNPTAKVSVAAVDKQHGEGAVGPVHTGPVELGQAITKLLQDREKPLRHSSH